MERRKMLMGGGFLALGAVAGFGMTRAMRDNSVSKTEDIAYKDVILGDPEAPVRMTEYGSLTCTHCGAFARESFPQIKADYVDAGKMSFAFREVYFDNYGLIGGIIAYELSKGRTDTDTYYDFIKGVFEDQQRILYDAPSGDEAMRRMIELGQTMGLPDDYVPTSSDDIVKDIVEQSASAMKRDEVSSTPVFLINNQRVNGNDPDEIFRILKKI